MGKAVIEPGERNLITDVAGIAVGNAEDVDVRSGVSVVLPEERAIAGVSVMGGAPGTRETDALDPANLVDAVDAVVLSGGSVYGLDAASGVTAWLGARGRGFQTPSGLAAPVVPGAILFDLNNGGDKSWGEAPPYRALGLKACEAASARFSLGNQGAGLGAAAGDLKGGLGSASAVYGRFTVGALAAVNAAGSVLMPGTDRFWAAPFEMGSEFGGRGLPDVVPEGDPFEGVKFGRLLAEAREHTTIAVVATDAALTAAEARRVALMAQDGLARAIRPVHTPFDGDAVFVLATGREAPGERRPLVTATIGALAADCLARAVARGVYEAETLGALESYKDRFKA